jgi:molybdopterin converting factor small subunit
MKAGDTLSSLQSSKASGESTALVKLVGSLGKLPDGTRIRELFVGTPVIIGAVLTLIEKQDGIAVRRDSTLVMVNGIEAGALADLETVVVAGDEVVLVPMFHGG